MWQYQVMWPLFLLAAVDALQEETNLTQQPYLASNIFSYRHYRQQQGDHYHTSSYGL